jgi:aromatic ring-opening dioxygenase catalytic subunit (LigB family)
MAEIVGIVATSHAPGATGWLDKCEPQVQRNLLEGFRELGRIVRGTKPDAIIGLSNDHILNLPVDNTPDFCVGTADMWQGPGDFFKDWLKIPDYRVRGHRDLARTLVNQADRRGIKFAYSDTLQFDDNFSVPLYYLTPDYDIPLVPIHMNCIMPPLPTPERCFETGRAIAEIVRNHRPANERILIMGTGGLAHDPGGPKYFQVNPEFDRWFLGLLGTGNCERVLGEATIDRMIEAGDGGTTELLAWIAAMGAAGDRPARTIFYEAPPQLRCGMGAVVWHPA